MYAQARVHARVVCVGDKLGVVWVCARVLYACGVRVVGDELRSLSS